MSAVINSSGISIEFTPWTDQDFSVSLLHMYESIGGELAKGYIELLFPHTENSGNLLTEEQTGLIKLQDTKEGGLNFDIPVFIISRQFFKNVVKLNFVCVEDKKFFMDPISISYSDIRKALETLYPGKLDIRTESDINNDVVVYQMNETDQEFCTTLAISYKKDAIFSFGWEGLLIKDLVGKNSRGKDENNEDNNLFLMGQGIVENSDYYSLNYNKRLLYEPQDLWEEKEEKPVNLGSIKNYDRYFIAGTDYIQMMKNREHNLVIMNSDLYTSLIVTGTDMPNYKLGDIVTYRRAEQDINYPFTKFLVFSNELFLSQGNVRKVGPHGYSFEWTSKLLGVEMGKWGMK